MSEQVCCRQTYAPYPWSITNSNKNNRQQEVAGTFLQIGVVGCNFIRKFGLAESKGVTVKS
jgi:hypothetical protein